MIRLLSICCTMAALAALSLPGRAPAQDKPTPKAASQNNSDAKLQELEAKLKPANADHALICRQTLCELAYPQYAGTWETAVKDAKISID